MTETDRATMRLLKQMTHRIRRRQLARHGGPRRSLTYLAAVAIIIGALGFGYLVNYAIGQSRSNHNLIAQGHDARIADQKALQAEILKLEDENSQLRAEAAALANNSRDLACFTAAFFNTKPGVSPFIDSLRSRYKCAGYNPKKHTPDPTAASTFSAPNTPAAPPVTSSPGRPSPTPRPTPGSPRPSPHPTPHPTPTPRPTLPISVPSALCSLLNLPVVCSSP